MNRSAVRGHLIDALKHFHQFDLQLLRRDASEWSMAHRIAVYLERGLRDWHIDCEYNRSGFDEKRAGDGTIVRPDIIVHHRGEAALIHNLLVVELKKRADEEDLGKAAEYTSPPTGDRPFQYQYGVALSLLPRVAAVWYSNGMREE